MMHWGGGYGWGMGFGGLFMVVFWALVILVIVHLVRTGMRSGKDREQKETPLDILKKRCARGEITKEEFEKIKDDLMKS